MYQANKVKKTAYDYAQICVKGHLINDRALTMQEFNETRCSECGSKTIMHCQKCSTPIKGKLILPSNYSIYTEPEIPLCCHSCGKAYPWKNQIKWLQNEADNHPFRFWSIVGGAGLTLISLIADVSQISAAFPLGKLLHF